MAAYTVAVGDVGKYELALAAATEDTVTFGGAAGDAQVADLQQVEIFHHFGASPLYVRFGTTAATVKGDGCYMVTPGTAISVEPPTSGETVVRVISAASATYSVANGG